jgi:hypothetical protein
MQRPLALAICAMLAFSCNKKNDDTVRPSSDTTDPPCSYTIGPWSAWSNGIRTREVTATPSPCTGTPPASIDYHTCYTDNKMFLRVVNYSSNPYRITITGPTTVPVFDLPGGYMRDSIMVNTGTYGLHSLQLSGYVLYPSEFNGTISSSTKCTTNAWSFP